jgi:hypothetical protein
MSIYLLSPIPDALALSFVALLALLFATSTLFAAAYLVAASTKMVKERAGEGRIQWLFRNRVRPPAHADVPPECPPNGSVTAAPPDDEIASSDEPTCHLPADQPQDEASR